ncbi:MAG: ATP-binding protein [Deltaproteobacteria bacterium]
MRHVLSHSGYMLRSPRWFGLHVNGQCPARRGRSRATLQYGPLQQGTGMIFFPSSRSRRSSRVASEKNLLPRARLYALRALVASGTGPGSGGYDAASVAELYQEVIGKAAQNAKTRKAMSDAAQRAIRVLAAKPIPEDSTLFRNARLLSEAVALSEVERALFLLVLLSESVPFLRQALDMSLRCGRLGLEDLLAETLTIDVSAVREALWPEGRLFRVRFLTRDTDATMPLCVAEGLETVLGRSYDSREAMLANFFEPVAVRAHTLADFAHLGPMLDTTLAYLKGSLERRTKGANVLLFGPSGTGKTTLAEAIASELRVALFGVNARGRDGEALKREQRLAAYSLSQLLLTSTGKAIVLFDEIEDVFEQPVEFFFVRESRGRDKAWTNAMLEEHPVPTIWITNRLDVLDPSFLRRFDLALELGTPPMSVRRRLIDTALGDTSVSDPVRARFAADERITPAAVVQSLRVATIVSPGDPREREGVFARVLASRLEREPKPATVSAPCVATAYDLAFINADCDPGGLVESLREDSQASLCLFGAPGTGKSGYAAHLAQALGFDLVVRRASDLLGMYVGETEKNVAAMFSEGRRPRTMLFLDEADSFLSARATARARWEVSLVNEILVQMESHDGLFVCATNLVEALDEAALRRFSVVVKFEALRAEQRRAMLAATLTTLGVDPQVTDRAVLEALDRLDGLAPGDFAGAVKQLRLARANRSPEGFVELLRKRLESRRGRTGKAMGFV